VSFWDLQPCSRSWGKFRQWEGSHVNMASEPYSSLLESQVAALIKSLAFFAFCVDRPLSMCNGDVGLEGIANCILSSLSRVDRKRKPTVRNTRLYKGHSQTHYTLRLLRDQTHTSTPRVLCRKSKAPVFQPDAEQPM
jgi:hypothetical protein